MPAAAAGTRPRSSRGGSSRSNLAYDLGNRGEPMPEWVETHDGHRAAYEDGQADRDIETGNEPRAPRRRSSASKPTAPAAAAAPAAEPVTPAEPRRGGWRLFTGGGPSASSVANSIEVGDSVGSVLLGFVGYALLLNYVRGGWPQVRKWVAAKATNGHGTLP